MTVDTFLVLLPSTLLLAVILLYCETLVPDRGGKYWAAAVVTLFLGASLRPVFLPVGIALGMLFSGLLVIGVFRFCQKHPPIWFWPTFTLLVSGAVLRGATGWWQVRIPELPLAIVLTSLAAWTLVIGDRTDGRPRWFLTFVLCLLVPMQTISFALGDDVSRPVVMAWGSLGLLLTLAQIFSLLELLRQREASARRQAETKARTLKDRHRLFQTLVEHAPIGITFSDSEGRVALVNQRARDYLELGDHDECLGADLLEMLGRRSTSEASFDQFISKFEHTQDDRGVRGIVHLASSTGERTFDTIVTPQKAEGDRKLAQMAIMVDTTEQTSLERKLRQSQKMETIATLAAGIAHDFNNQLLVIQANIELSLLEDLTEDVEELVDAALNSTKHCSHIARDLLSFSRTELAQRQPLELAPLLREAQSFLKSTFPAGIALDVEIQDDSLTVLADETEMQQIIMNLANNARDALAGEGAILIRIERISGDPGPPFSSEEKAICLTVEDNGPGIPSDVRARIFEPFFTTKGEGNGTGLGLATVQGLVATMGGSIAVEGSSEGGARFKVLLPAGSRIPVESGLDQEPEARELAKAVLVVDDEPAIRDILRLWLTGRNCRVLEAGDGAEAVSMFLSRPDDIDLVIMDLSMPKMSGLDALLVMREARPQVQLVLSSGNLAQARGPIPGDVLRLAKPYSFSDLEDLLLGDTSKFAALSVNDSGLGQLSSQ